MRAGLVGVALASMVLLVSACPEAQGDEGEGESAGEGEGENAGEGEGENVGEGEGESVGEGEGENVGEGEGEGEGEGPQCLGTIDCAEIGASSGGMEQCTAGLVPGCTGNAGGICTAAEVQCANQPFQIPCDENFGCLWVDGQGCTDISGCAPPVGNGCGLGCTFIPTGPATCAGTFQCSGLANEEACTAIPVQGCFWSE